MNTQRRRALAKIVKQFHSLKEELETTLVEEEESFESLLDGLKDSERGSDIQDAVETLQAVSSLLDDALDELCTVAEIALPETKRRVVGESNPGQKWAAEFAAARKAKDRRHRKAARAESFLRGIGYLVIKENNVKYDRYYHDQVERVSKDGLEHIFKVEHTIRRENEKVGNELKELFKKQNLRIRKLIKKFGLEVE